MTNARDGWRKNDKDTSVVTIGEKSRLVLHHSHVTHVDDHGTQRHEKLRTERVYQYLEFRDTPVAVHIHDRNMAIDKLVGDRPSFTVNQNGVREKRRCRWLQQIPLYKRKIPWHREAGG